MKRKTLLQLPLAAVLLIGGCSAAHNPSPMSVRNDSPAAIPSPASSIVVVGSADAALSAKPGDTVAALLQSRLPSVMNGRPTTVVLVRRGPEGSTRELIDVDADRQLMDPHQNYVLRDGDKLILPSPAPLPTGLERPAAADIPAGE